MKSSVDDSAEVVVHTWHRAPRIRKFSPIDHDSLGVTSDELFWNFLFGNAFSYVASYFRVDQYIGGFFFCLVFFTSYVNQAVYATRFSDSDLLHRIFWVLFSLGIAGMVVNSGAPRTDKTLAPNTFAHFAGFCAWPKICLCFMYTRVAFYLPAARGLAISKMVDLGFHACIWLGVAVLVRSTGSFDFVWMLFFPLMADLLCIVPYGLVFLKLHAPVTISIECTSAKFNGLNGIMAAPIAVAVISCMHDWPEVDFAGYFTGFSAIMFVVLVNGMLARVNIMVPYEVHALRMSMHTSWIWFLMNFFWVASAMLTSVGFSRMFKRCPNDMVRLMGGEVQASFGAAGMFAVLCVLDVIHDAPWLSQALISHRHDRWGALGPVRVIRVMVHVMGMVVSSVVWLAPTFYVAPSLMLVTASGLVISSAASASFPKHRQKQIETEAEQGLGQSLRPCGGVA